MREQLKALGIAYDWDRAEFATCDTRITTAGISGFSSSFMKEAGSIRKKLPSIGVPPAKPFSPTSKVSASPDAAGAVTPSLRQKELWSNGLSRSPISPKIFLLKATTY